LNASHELFFCFSTDFFQEIKIDINQTTFGENFFYQNLTPKNFLGENFGKKQFFTHSVKLNVVLVIENQTGFSFGYQSTSTVYFKGSIMSPLHIYKKTNAVMTFSKLNKK